jgi:hypothetical protein
VEGKLLSNVDHIWRNTMPSFAANPDFLTACDDLG